MQIFPQNNAQFPDRSILNRIEHTCNALYLGIAPHVIMKWTGHTEYSAMKPYMDIADEQRRNSMAAFDAAIEHAK